MEKEKKSANLKENFGLICARPNVNYELVEADTAKLNADSRRLANCDTIRRHPDEIRT
jgi:hypothetical protein